MSTNRTIMHLVAAEPVGGTELANLSLQLARQRRKPAEFIHPSGKLLKVGDNQRTHRGLALRFGDPGIAVNVIRDRDGRVLHSFTVSQ